MVEEVLECLRPAPGDVAVDCTLGGGGHARALLERVQPGGRVIGLDVDPIELPRTEARLRSAGFGPENFVARQANFAGLPKVMAAEGLDAANVILTDLGVSSMQLDNPDRGFTYKMDGPLDMRMNPSRGESAAELLARVSEDALVASAQRERRRAARESHRPSAQGVVSEDHASRRSRRPRGTDVGVSELAEARRENVSPPHPAGAPYRGQ